MEIGRKIDSVRPANTAERYTQISSTKHLRSHQSRPGNAILLEDEEKNERAVQRSVYLPDDHVQLNRIEREEEKRRMGSETSATHGYLATMADDKYLSFTFIFFNDQLKEEGNPPT